MLKKNDVIELTIQDITNECLGVGRYENIVVFVPFTAVGDVAQVKIVKVQKSYCYGICTELTVSSPTRVAPPCPIFGKCGGCDLQHVAYAEELLLKEKWVRDSFQRLGKIDMPIAPTYSADEWRYRNKAVIPLHLGVDGKVTAGFYAKRSHRVVPHSNCILHPEIFEGITEAITDFLTAENITVYDESSHSGVARHIFIRSAEGTGQLMVGLIVNEEASEWGKRFADYITGKFSEITTVFLNVNTRDTNVLMGERCVTLHGSGTITDEILGVSVVVSPLSFHQVNHKGAEKLYSIVAEYCGDLSNKTVFDLYCGTGIIGLTIAKHAKKIVGVDIVPDAISDAQKNATLNGITNTTFICDDAVETARVLAEKGEQPNIVIVDPPRKGCPSSFAETIALLSPKTLIYVSCNPSTAARDIAVLLPLGYEAEKAEVVNMFPKAGHVECVIKINKI